MLAIIYDVIKRKRMGILLVMKICLFIAIKKFKNRIHAIPSRMQTFIITFWQANKGNLIIQTYKNHIYCTQYMKKIKNQYNDITNNT